MKHLKIEIALLAAAIAPVIISFAASCHTGQGMWFSRSGALAVLFTAMLEYRRARRATDEIATAVLQGGLNVSLYISPNRAETVVHRSAVTVLILGTVVWGYGDLLF